MLKRLFLQHPRSIGETYLEHQKAAWSIAFALLGSGFACLIHGVVPGLFRTTGSRTIARLHERITVGRAGRHVLFALDGQRPAEHRERERPV